MARAEGGSRRLRRLHLSHDRRAACAARHPRALAGRVAVEIAAEPRAAYAVIRSARGSFQAARHFACCSGRERRDTATKVQGVALG